GQRGRELPGAVNLGESLHWRSPDQPTRTELMLATMPDDALSVRTVSSSSRTLSPGLSVVPVMTNGTSAPAAVIATAAPGPMSAPIEPSVATRYALICAVLVVSVPAPVIEALT